MIKNIYFLVLAFFVVSTQQLLAQEVNQKIDVDAVSYSQQLRQSYQQEDQNVKNNRIEMYSSSPGASFWRQIRANKQHNTQIRGNDAGVAINDMGEYWRNYRQGLKQVSGSTIVVALLAVLAIFLFFGRFKIKAGFSKENIQRFELNERIIHWGVASLFILLALTGLLLLFGSSTIIPLFGKEVNSIIASAAKEVHDIAGPIFSVFLLLTILRFIRDNFYQKGDLEWLLKGGGLFSSHVDTWRFNLGEKGWFWIVFFAGILISVSGYIMLFDDLVSGQRVWIEYSHIVHSVSAVLMTVALFGHIYMAVALEGSMSAMTQGVVDKNWAKEHHSLWYKEQLKNK